MEEPSPPAFRILPTTQQYDWGKVGLTSKVGQLAVGSNPNFTLENSRPYAELWMGTHPSSPSLVFSSGVSLPAHLSAHPQLVGSRVIERFGTSGGGLPFLLKVLSIGKALSIQTHPDKLTAERLHAAHPHIYKDDNHKPEMAVALTPFSALCGFLPLEQISLYLAAVPEFAALIPEPIATHFKNVSSSTDPDSQSALRSVFSALMTADSQAVTTQLRVLVARYRDGGASPVERDVAALVLLLYSQFPDDIGVFCVYMLNHVQLQPGEAIFLGAGEPHAYISGDIIECMANSDNVIRAGLTPKLRDVSNLLENLTYTCGDPARHAVQSVPFKSLPPPEQHNPATLLYLPPTPEFAVLRTVVNPGCVEKHRAISGPSIVLVLTGRGMVHWAEGNANISPGHVLFVAEGTEVRFEAGAADTDDAGKGDTEDLVVFRAFVEV